MKNLIIADDHNVVREALSELLQSRGDFSVIGQAADGEQLLALLRSNSPDLVIMDLEMPNVGGVEALERLRANDASSKIPVLVLSANENPSSIRAALKAGARGFVPKHAQADELEFAIKSVLQGKTYLSPSVTQGLVGGNISDQADSPIARLSKREVEILVHLANGKPNREIGTILGISTRTVDTHRSNILKKLELRTNAELVKLAIGHGLITV
jgi:two-component system, NarL family, invasion response regulator UvrY